MPPAPINSNVVIIYLAVVRFKILKWYYTMVYKEGNGITMFTLFWLENSLVLDK